MSSPNTNIEKQTKRHWGPLVGIALCTALALSLFVYFQSTALKNNPNSQAAPTIVEE